MAVDLYLGLVMLIDDEPTLLPPVYDEDVPLYNRDMEQWGPLIDHRSLYERHMCLKCGGQAKVAYIAATLIGPRWLDLCPMCALGVRNAMWDT